MKAIFKRSATISLVTIGGIFMPVFSVFAQEHSASQNICLTLVSATAIIRERLSDRGADVDDRELKRVSALTTRRQDRDARIEAHWERGEERRALAYASLRAHAVTESQQKAVAEFGASLDAAWRARRAAIERAIQALRESVDERVAERKEIVSGARDIFKNNITAALKSAEAACKKRGDTRNIRSDLLAAIRKAEEVFSEKRTLAQEKMGGLQSLIDAYNMSLEKAELDFVSELEEARTKLRQAL